MQYRSCLLHTNGARARFSLLLRFFSCCTPFLYWWKTTIALTYWLSTIFPVRIVFDIPDWGWRGCLFICGFVSPGNARTHTLREPDECKSHSELADEWKKATTSHMHVPGHFVRHPGEQHTHTTKKRYCGEEKKSRRGICAALFTRMHNWILFIYLFHHYWHLHDTLLNTSWVSAIERRGNEGRGGGLEATRNITTMNNAVWLLERCAKHESIEFNSFSSSCSTFSYFFLLFSIFLLLFTLSFISFSRFLFIPPPLFSPRFVIPFDSRHFVVGSFHAVKLVCVSVCSNSHPTCITQTCAASLVG